MGHNRTRFGVVGIMLSNVWGCSSCEETAGSSGHERLARRTEKCALGRTGSSLGEQETKDLGGQFGHAW